jgi:hypothetical protein
VVEVKYTCSNYLPLVLLTPMASLPPVSTTPVTICHWAQFAADVIYTGGKFATIVIDTRSKFVASGVDTGGAP